MYRQLVEKDKTNRVVQHLNVSEYALYKDIVKKYIDLFCVCCSCSIIDKRCVNHTCKNSKRLIKHVSRNGYYVYVDYTDGNFETVDPDRLHVLLCQLNDQHLSRIYKQGREALFSKLFVSELLLIKIRPKQPVQTRQLVLKNDWDEDDESMNHDSDAWDDISDAWDDDEWTQPNVNDRYRQIASILQMIDNNELDSLRNHWIPIDESTIPYDTFDGELTLLNKHVLGTIVHYVCTHAVDRQDIVTFVLEKSKHIINMTDNHGKTPLDVSPASLRPLLVKYGGLGNQYTTFVKMSTYLKNKQTVDILTMLQEDVDIRGRGVCDNTLMHVACAYGSIEVLGRLLACRSCDASVYNGTNNNGAYPLDIMYERLFSEKDALGSYRGILNDMRQGGMMSHYIFFERFVLHGVTTNNVMCVDMLLGDPHRSIIHVDRSNASQEMVEVLKRHGIS